MCVGCMRYACVCIKNANLAMLQLIRMVFFRKAHTTIPYRFSVFIERNVKVYCTFIVQRWGVIIMICKKALSYCKSFVNLLGGLPLSLHLHARCSFTQRLFILVVPYVCTVHNSITGFLYLPLYLLEYSHFQVISDWLCVSL